MGTASFAPIALASHAASLPQKLPATLRSGSEPLTGSSATSTSNGLTFSARPS